MKKLILLLAAGFTALSVNAQTAKTTSLVRVNDEAGVSGFVQDLSPLYNPATAAHPSANHANAKVTNGGSRWYYYADYLKKYGKVYDSLGGYIWYQPNSYWTYSGNVQDTMRNVSDVMVCDPYWSGFNDSNAYPGQIFTGPLDSYLYDSVEITGAYVLAKTGITDNLILSFFYGDLTTGSNIFHDGEFIGSSARNIAFLANYGLAASDSLFVFATLIDSMTQSAKANTAGASAITSMTVQLHEGDTSLNGNGNFKNYRYAVPNGGLTCPAGHTLMGCSVTFQSGDVSFQPYDTVSTNNGFNYNAFLPMEYYRASGTNPGFPSYYRPEINANVGMFKQEPDAGWPHQYVTMYAWSANNGASAAQSQYVGIKFHINCTTCALTNTYVNPNAVNNIEKSIESVNVLPNPATSQVAISFNLNSSANTTITLTNTLGQVVKTQNMGNVSNGQAIFNVSELANGVYFYSVVANGERSTGRVVVAH